MAASDIRAALGLRPMALTEMSREADRPSLAILSDDDDLLVRVDQIGRRSGLKVTPGAIAPTHTSRDSGAGNESTALSPGRGNSARALSGSLVFGPRAGFEKVLEVLAVSGDKDEAALALSIERALSGPPAREIPWRAGVLRLSALEQGGTPLVMGILNVTPDSFSDGGRFADPQAAIARGLQMAGEGASIIDVGGESSRPGAESVPADEEIRRVVPVIGGLAAELQVPISIDTTRSEVARRAVASGASVINDISGLTMDPQMAAVAAELGVPVMINHIRGVPKTMQESPTYDHVVLEVLVELAGRVRAAREAGIAASRIIVDPGIGFGKRSEDNLALLRHLPALRALEAPILAGVSRKSFLGAITGRSVSERTSASLAAEVLAAIGGADIIRTHEPAAAIDALKVVKAFHGPLVTH